MIHGDRAVCVAIGCSANPENHKIKAKAKGSHANYGEDGCHEQMTQPCPKVWRALTHEGRL